MFGDGGEASPDTLKGALLPEERQWLTFAAAQSGDDGEASSGSSRGPSLLGERQLVLLYTDDKNVAKVREEGEETLERKALLTNNKVRKCHSCDEMVASYYCASCRGKVNSRRRKIAARQSRVQPKNMLPLSLMSQISDVMTSM